MFWKKRFSRTCLALILLLSLLPAGIPAGAEVGLLKGVSSFEGGAAYRTAGDIYWVLQLSGSWHEMGRQYGALVSEDLKLFHQEITADVEARGQSLDQQLEAAQAFALGLNEDLKALMEGMAETSGLTHDEVLLLNCGMANLTGAILGETPPCACSGIAAWNQYTPGGKLVFGRNWDIDRAGMKKYMKYLSVVVFNPEEGNGFANVHPLGNVYMETGINEKGLFVELNNGEYSDPAHYEDRMDTASVLSTLLNQCDGLDDAVAYLSREPADISYILQLADSSRCVSVERPTFDCRVREGDEKGLLAAYNSFVPPYPKEWEGKVAAPKASKDDARYDNLVSLANSERFFGKLDPAGMMELMDVRYQEGGAVLPATVVQAVAVPEELRLWIRGFEYSDWQEVRLEPLFNAR